MAAKGKKIFNAETSNKKKVEELEPIVFDYYGVELTALSWIPGIVTLRYVEGIANEEDGAAQLGAVRYYLENSFDAENLAKFNRVVNDPENGIEIEDLMSLLKYLSEERAQRPLKDSSQ